MYAVVKNGKVIGMTEKPRFIRKVGGIYVEAPPDSAQGVAFRSVPYNLPGGGMEGLETVDVKEVDAGETIRTLETAAADTDTMMVDQEYRLTMLELGLTEEGGN